MNNTELFKLSSKDFSKEIDRLIAEGDIRAMDSALHYAYGYINCGRR